VLGANVTIPYKEAVITEHLVDEIDDTASRIGSVNTLVHRWGRLVGSNTDAAGFMEALRVDGRFEPAGKSALLLGAGGAARAVAFSLAQAGAAKVTITNRTSARSVFLAQFLRQQSGRGVTIDVREWGGIRKGLECYDLIVNCTSLGMKDSPGELQSPLNATDIPRNVLVFDLVYNPIRTPLLVEAAKAGARTLGGLSMLVYQGAASFELWTGRSAPVDIMMRAAEKALGQHKQVPGRRHG